MERVAALARTGATGGYRWVVGLVSEYSEKLVWTSLLGTRSWCRQPRFWGLGGGAVGRCVFTRRCCVFSVESAVRASGASSWLPAFRLASGQWRCACARRGCSAAGTPSGGSPHRGTCRAGAPPRSRSGLSRGEHGAIPAPPWVSRRYGHARRQATGASWSLTSFSPITQPTIPSKSRILITLTGS